MLLGKNISAETENHNRNDGAYSGRYGDSGTIHQAVFRCAVKGGEVQSALEDNESRNARRIARFKAACSCVRRTAECCEMRRAMLIAAEAGRSGYGLNSLNCRLKGSGSAESAVIITKGGERWCGIFHTLLKPCFDGVLSVDKPVRMVYHYVGRRNSSRFFYIGYCIFVSAWAS